MTRALSSGCVKLSRQASDLRSIRLSVGLDDGDGIGDGVLGGGGETPGCDNATSIRSLVSRIRRVR